MRSTFSGLEINRTGLFVAQKNIDVTGHNISNMNTPGYTRQRIIQASIDPERGNMRFLSPEKGYVGRGVQIMSLDQVRSVYLDKAYRDENTLAGEWDARSDALYYMEDLFGDIFDTAGDSSSITTAVDSFFSSIQDLTQHPESSELRTIVRQEALKLTEILKHYRSELGKLQKAQNDEIDVQVLKVNDIVSSMAALNEQIFKFEMTGVVANDLRDKRNLLLDELSNIVDIEYYETEERYFVLNIAGQEAVNHIYYNSLEVSHDREDFDGESDMFSSIEWVAGDGDIAAPSATYLTADELGGGRLRGLLAMRDGNSEEEMGVPYFISRLDDFAKGLVEAVNSVHYGDDSWGYPDPRTGAPAGNRIYFFDPDCVTAKDISLDIDILDSIYNICASSSYVDTGSNTGNNEVALRLAELQTSMEIPGIGNFKDYLKEIIGNVAVEASHAYTVLDGQETLVLSIENQRQQISGVSQDEELINLVKFEKAYNASARMITSFDECLDTLINRTGIVGR